MRLKYLRNNKLEAPEIKIIKSSIPIVWLDTFIIINMSKWKLGDSIDKVQKERVSYLYDQIYQLTRNGKIICPIADQKEEIWKGRSDFLKTMLELSLGIHAKYSVHVSDDQTKIFMAAFINKKENVEINFNDFFRSDPIKQLKSKSKIITSVDLGLLERPDEIRNKSISQVTKLEELRLSIIKQGISFEEQLEKEYQSELEAIAILVRKSKEQLIPSDFLGFNDYPLFWNQMKGDKSNFISFFYSNYYKKIPFNDISSQMSAKIITGDAPIKSGHKMDINHASSALPYVDIFITDRYMKKIICDLGLDKNYNTLVLNIGELKEVEKYFANL